MKKIEHVYREVLYEAIEKKNKTLTQSYLSKALDISLSTVNHSLKPLKRMQAILIKKRGFDVIDVKKILYYWASIRNLEKDTIYKTRADFPIRDVEKQMPDNIIYTAYSAYKLKFREVPADYTEVYVYGDETIRKRFKESKNPANLFVLKKDALMEKYGTVTIANLFADLWNLQTWYAKDFLRAMEERIDAILE